MYLRAHVFIPFIAGQAIEIKQGFEPMQSPRHKMTNAQVNSQNNSLGSLSSTFGKAQFQAENTHLRSGEVSRTRNHSPGNVSDVVVRRKFFPDPTSQRIQDSEASLYDV